ncbi:Ger(x)C family spore germination protein [Alkalihalobacillus sp. MEB130]|uniref:Ger(x)C family spore germination protein n=1 Tax=Alkalihalobacillus sp. MEB130 TaxID=2976704 RepID=UPI0028DF4ABC|nr:Ger(x)C family spore germination protein [Alkalihalobacillus sp. MEB130]MDT8860661.1 Ger(x)C family spore germination protein [Alkalihalobacillus sp. MEB130]
MSRKKFLVTILLLLLGIATGCWDRKELDQVSLVTGLALEISEDDAFSLTIEAINASELNAQTAEGLAPTITYELKGLTMAELLNKMNMGITRELNFSHTRTLIVDEKVAEEGISKFLQFLEKSGQFRNDFQIIVAKGVKATDIITTTYPIQKVPSMKMYEQFTTIEETWGGYPQSALTDFVFSLTSEGRHPVSAAVTVKGKPEEGHNVDDNKDLDLDAVLEYSGMAMFHNDRLVGFLSVEETRNYMWTQDINRTTATAPCGEDGYFALQIYNSHTKVDASFENDVPKFTVRVIIEGDIHDNQCAHGLDEISTYENYQKIMEEHLEEKLTKTITSVQENHGVDVFGFGEHLSKQQYKKFKEHVDDWDEEFSHAVIDVVASVYIRRDGMRTKSFIDQLDE